MATFKELQKCKHYTGEDYKKFQTKYINYIRSICRDNGWELTNIGKNHYYFSAFIKDNQRCVYLSIPDVRYKPNGWYDSILVRCAKNERDYQGAWNNYTTLDNLSIDIGELLKRWNYDGN